MISSTIVEILGKISTIVTILRGSSVTKDGIGPSKPCNNSDFQNVEVKTSKNWKSRLPDNLGQDFQYFSSSDTETLLSCLLRSRSQRKEGCFDLVH